MSKLSELLNPLPSLNATRIHPQTEPPVNHVVHSTKEPALESPLTAATSNAPLLSPTKTLAPFISSFVPPYQSQLSQATASRLSSPSLLEHSHQPEHSTSAFSIGLEQKSCGGNTCRNSSPAPRSTHDENNKSGLTVANGVSEEHVHRKAITPELQEINPKPYSNNSYDTQRSSLRQESEPPQTLRTTQITATHPAEVEVKAEIMENLPDIPKGDTHHADQGDRSPRASSQPSDTAMETAPSRMVTELKNDVTYQPSAKDSEASTRSPSAIPKTPRSKKRPAPKSKAEKKGTASTVKRAAKRRKLDDDSVDGSPPVQRSETPASSRASKTPAPKNRKRQSVSVTPLRSSSPVDDEDEQDDEDKTLFCICHKPDDHTWMIACDGGCEDWFHGRCVGIDESDGKLIDKYFCPNCKENGIGQTTWKPMCRLITCRNPARVSGPEPSKYCSDVHGAEYMRIHAMKREPEEPKTSAQSSIRNRKRRRDNHTDHFGNGDENFELAEESNTLRGGVLRAAELKTLANGVKNIAEFRKLGEGVLSPPCTASPEDDGDNAVKSKGKPQKSKSAPKPKNFMSYSASELQQLSEIATKRENLQARKGMLDDRERFLGFVKTRAKRVLEDLRKTETVKDICGFDARLSWSDDEFMAWRSSSEGQTALNNGILTAAPLPDITTDGSSHPEAPTEIQKDGGDEDEIGRGVCQKRRCERHRAWWKLQQQDILFEKGEVRAALGRLGGEEEGVRKRAVVRRLEEG